MNLKRKERTEESSKKNSIILKYFIIFVSFLTSIALFSILLIQFLFSLNLFPLSVGMELYYKSGHKIVCYNLSHKTQKRKDFYVRI